MAVCVLTVTAQTDRPYSGSIDVNGLVHGKNYTDAQMRAKLGEPTRYRSQDDELGGTRSYQYGPEAKYDLFRWSGQDGFNIFTLETPKYSLFKGLLKVGDNISKISLLGFGTLEVESSIKHRYLFHYGWTDCPLEIQTDFNRVITRIRFSIPM